MGWRSHSVTSLTLSSIQILESSMVVKCKEFKNVGPSGLPVGTLSFTKLPNLFLCVR